MTDQKSKKSKATPASIALGLIVAGIAWAVNHFTGDDAKAEGQTDRPVVEAPAEKPATARKPPPSQPAPAKPAPDPASTVNAPPEDKPAPPKTKPEIDRGAQKVADAFRRRLSGIMVQVKGKVRATLPDDNEGSRHQKFILELSTKKTLLVAHNIDLAPRIDELRRGDEVEIKGQYEWSEKGGVLHWTHHDPRKRHAEGWIKHDGKTYQ